MWKEPRKEHFIMSSLAVFPPPSLQENITLSEYNSSLTIGDPSRRNIPSLYTFGQDCRYDEILPTEDTFKIPTNLARDLLESPFLPVEESITQKLYNIWLTDGVDGVLEELSETNAEVPAAISLGSGKLFALLKWIEKTSAKLTFSKKLDESPEINSSGLSGPVQAFAWHPHLTKFAVGFEDDSIRIFTFKRGLTKLLNHRYQKAISCCAWRPLSASILAVGCQNGVLVWKVDPQSTAIRLGAGSVQFLSHPGHSFITSISWSPGGRLLLSGSATSAVMMVWDVTMESGTALHRIGGAISYLSWSPCDTKIFVATESSLIRVWETQKWTCEKWTNLASRCQAACWSPDGKVLVFSVAKERNLYYLRFCEPVGNTGMENFDIGGAKMAVKCADLSEHSWVVDGKSVSIGGYVKAMAWDPSGERLAVILRDDEGNSQNHIPVFKTTLGNVFELVPSGFIHGLPSDGYPQLLSFQRNFKQGALLSVVWSSGKVSFIPMLFSPRSVIENNNSSRVFSNGKGHATGGLYSE